MAPGPSRGHAGPRWGAWLGDELTPPPTAEGVAGLVERWLRAFGPGSVGDIKWWLGSTRHRGEEALQDLKAVEVEFDDGDGYLLPDDLEPTEPPDPWAALLPPLDPTTMGWYEREWYLGPIGQAVRHERQWRSDGLVGRPDRRGLAPGRRRRGGPSDARGSGR